MAAEDVAKFGEKTPLGRPAQPDEADASFITGVILPVMGGETIGG
jgi:hypothetical protein